MIDPDDTPGQLPGLLASPADYPRFKVSRPPNRTRLTASVSELRCDGDHEVLELTVKNDGDMTAPFLESRPLLNYRTDLIVDNLRVSMLPGEMCRLVLRAPRKSAVGLSLTQTGWTITSWNADPVVLQLLPDIVLAVGWTDRKSREFGGEAETGRVARAVPLRVQGRRPDPSGIPCRPAAFGHEHPVAYAF